jgi:hypothetical protein
VINLQINFFSRCRRAPPCRFFHQDEAHLVISVLS